MDRNEVMRIHGRWEESEPENWEEFTIMLHGKEAGDVLTDWTEIRRVLSEAGYELVRARGKQEKV